MPEGSSFQCLRFYADGQVLSVSTPGTPDQIESWFVPGGNASAGTYTIDAGVLSFRAVGTGASVEFTGTIEAGDELDLKSTSSNGRQAHRRFSFVSFGGDAASATADPVTAEPLEALPLEQMTDAEVLALFDEEQPIAMPYFGNQPVELRLYEELADAELANAVRNVLALTASDRDRDGRHLLAYCELMVEAAGAEVLDDMGGEMPTLDTIWDFVTPRFLSFSAADPGPYVDRRTVFAVMEGAVAWEPEHGLQMCWADGTRLVKVGEFDGHQTNGMAAANPEHDKYVFAGYAPFTTERDPVD